MECGGEPAAAAVMRLRCVLGVGLCCAWLVVLSSVHSCVRAPGALRGSVHSGLVGGGTRVKGRAPS